MQRAKETWSPRLWCGGESRCRRAPGHLRNSQNKKMKTRKAANLKGVVDVLHPSLTGLDAFVGHFDSLLSCERSGGAVLRGEGVGAGGGHRLSGDLKTSVDTVRGHLLASAG